MNYPGADNVPRRDYPIGTIRHGIPVRQDNAVTAPPRAVPSEDENNEALGPTLYTYYIYSDNRKR